MWHLEEEHEDDHEVTRHPIAVEWGGQSLRVDGRPTNFALATNLSNVCRLLDVSIVTDHQLTAQPFWGATGHYAIGRVAIDAVTETDLHALLAANVDRISPPMGQIVTGTVNDLLDPAHFVPLADVPDIVWKKVHWKVTGGRDVSNNTGPEHPNHYCDIDEPGADGRTLRQLCIEDPANVSVPVWQSFYTALHHTDAAERGCLPFRVWQIHDAMVGFVAAGEASSFVAAAGVLAHYVGDACQPLHGSFRSDGYRDQATHTTTSTGTPKEIWPGKGVHSAFETKMIDRHASDLAPMIAAELPNGTPPAVGTGHAAACAVIDLMERTANRLPPTDLCDRYVELGEGASHEVLDGLWSTFRDATAAAMADGARVLAGIWTSAWQAGGGGLPPDEIAKTSLMSRYRNVDGFVPSLDLDDLAAALGAPV